MAPLKVETQPWTTPNFVTGKMPARPRGEGIVEGPTWPLNAVDVDVLSQMCDEFRAEVFRKAGKSDPELPVGDGGIPWPGAVDPVGAAKGR